jgi:hypothetical protein
MRQQVEAPKAKKARNKFDVPMSENVRKITDDWTADQCIEELRRVAKLDEDKVVTRNYFRVHGRIAESVWNGHFGTFEEFKRQAGIKLSRAQHAHERNIAKHASVDQYRELNAEKRSWSDRYIRENGSRFKTMVIGSDFHDIEIDPFFLRVWLDVIRRVQPDNVIYGGDVFDLPEFGKYGVDPREWDVVGRIRFAHDRIFGPSREAAPNAQFDFIEGNHEARLLRHLADATPALRAVLSDLHGFTVSKLLGLEQFEINYTAKADLAAWTKRDFDKELANNYKIFYNTVLVHHFPHARNMGLPGVNGHHHRHQVWAEFSPVYGEYEWHQLGSGHKRSASYCEGERWHNGFVIANVDTQTKAVTFDYIQVRDHAVAGGMWYYREEHERDLFLKSVTVH